MPALVLIERHGAGLSEWKYTRVLDRKVTHKAVGPAPLDRIDLEAFRTDPDKVLGDQPKEANA